MARFRQIGEILYKTLLWCFEKVLRIGIKAVNLRLTAEQGAHVKVLSRAAYLSVPFASGISHRGVSDKEICQRAFQSRHAARRVLGEGHTTKEC